MFFISDTLFGTVSKNTHLCLVFHSLAGNEKNQAVNKPSFLS